MKPCQHDARSLFIVAEIAVPAVQKLPGGLADAVFEIVGIAVYDLKAVQHVSFFVEVIDAAGDGAPAADHAAVGAEVIGISVDGLHAGQADPFLIEIIGVGADLLEAGQALSVPVIAAGACFRIIIPALVDALRVIIIEDHGNIDAAADRDLGHGKGKIIAYVQEEGLLGRAVHEGNSDHGQSFSFLRLGLYSDGAAGHGRAGDPGKSVGKGGLAPAVDLQVYVSGHFDQSRFVVP